MILRPLGLILALPLLHVVLRATPLGSDPIYVLIGMTTIFLAWLAIGAVSGAIALFAAPRRDWRQAASWGAVALAIGVGAINHNHVRAFTNVAGDTLNFVVHLADYRKRIAALPTMRRSWSSSIAAA